MPELHDSSAQKRPANGEIDLTSDEDNPENDTELQRLDCSEQSAVRVRVGKEQKRAIQTRVDDSFASQKSFTEDGVKAGRVTNAMLFMISKDNMPLNTVEKEGFRTLMKTVAPLYKIPGRKITTTLIEEKYTILSLEVKTELRTIDYFSITTDVWTDTLNTRSFLGVTAHFVADASLKSALLAVTELDDRHTASNLGEWLIGALDQWNIPIEKVVAVISDNASNITKAITDIFGADKHLPCFAHSPTNTKLWNKRFEMVETRSDNRSNSSFIPHSSNTFIRAYRCPPAKREIPRLY